MAMRSQAVLHPWRVRIGFVILVLGITFAFVQQASKDNATRCAVVGVVVKLSENSARNARATAASPTATRAQKAAAATNLKQIRDRLTLVADVLGHPHGKLCVLP